ncbi:hypothetical protein J5N97_022438 [Dioscorea zingiberensis]|uniref:Protein ENHANCED DISEASE RESISTANCE 2 C-terminal domain-containing protein n=1 Tax=Dioscorea zingiberensis TaxID=325984 RepID=A0A9D5CA30_9LILI|nr:hypothetical protein J5N97_022438 [Dioscorea zingiberensis]
MAVTPFRNAQFKTVNRIVKGSWIVKAAVYLLGCVLTCNYHRGENHFEINVNIGSRPSPAPFSISGFKGLRDRTLFGNQLQGVSDLVEEIDVLGGILRELGKKLEDLQ